MQSYASKVGGYPIITNSLKTNHGIMLNVYFKHNQCDVGNSVSNDTRKGLEMQSTDLWDRAKMLEFWLKEYEVNVNYKSEEETLLLMCLRTRQSDSCIMRLIEIECNVNATCRYGKTPLHHAVQRSTMMVAIELIKRGANINAQGHNEITPLHFAAEKNHEAVCMLLYYGADIHLRCGNLLSPLVIAICDKKFDSIQTLMDYHEDEDLYEDIDFFMYFEPNPIETLFSSKNSRLFKLAWSYINHDSLTEFDKPCLVTFLDDCNFPTNEWYECLQLILQSYNIVELIEHYNDFLCTPPKTFVIILLEYALYYHEIEINKRTNIILNIIFMVLSAGMEVCLNDFNYVFEFLGFGAELEAFIYAADYHTVYNSELFRFALLPFILAFSNDFSTKTIVSLLKKQMKSYFYVKDMKQNNNTNALKFFSFNSNAKAELLQNLWGTFSDNWQTRNAINEVPEVPSLLELSRNQIYLSIRNGHKIKKPYHFHDAVKSLLLPQALKDVIIFKRPIY